MKQISAGGVMVKGHGAQAQVCLIAHREGRRRVWGLPKGHVELGETLTACALREVREETGLSGELVAKLGVIAYTFTVSTPRRARIAKTVHFYLMRYRRGRTADHDDEVEQAAWLSIPRALKRMTYPSERRMVRLAQQLSITGVR
jgi:ADP-ribose pyrophosphatase YjhB (NUDIX family)